MSDSSSVKNRGIDINGLSPLETAGMAISKAADPYGVTTSLLNAQMAWMMHPQELLRAASALSGDLLALQTHVMRRALGMPSADVIEPNPDDVRFADPVWTDAATWDIIKEWYLAFTHRLQDMYFETPGLSDKERRRAAFWLRKWLNMVAPTNFFWLNPVAMERFVETNGESLARGFQNFLRDVKARNIRMVEPDAFKVGKDLATTPGKVVFRNRLVELIHYAPTTETSSRDADRHRHAVDQQVLHPRPERQEEPGQIPHRPGLLGLHHQLEESGRRDVRCPLRRLPARRRRRSRARRPANSARSPKVHLVGYCIGGTLVSTYMAWANKRFGADQVPVAHWTLFTTLTDFSHPGDIDVFIDEACIGALEESMAKTGYLDGNEMATSFRLLRSNSLIWHYWVSSYLLRRAAAAVRRAVLEHGHDAHAARHAFLLPARDVPAQQPDQARRPDHRRRDRSTSTASSSRSTR